MVIVILGSVLMLLQSELTVIPANSGMIYVDDPVMNEVPVSSTAIKLLGEFLQLAGGINEDELEEHCDVFEEDEFAKFYILMAL